MIVEILKDMATFGLVLAVAMIGFGNVFYILYINGVVTDDDSSGDDSSLE